MSDNIVIPTPGGDDPFHPSRIGLSQDFTAHEFAKKAILTVPVRKPDRQWFIRVHPDPDWRLPVATIELKEERELYLVDRPLWPELPGEIVPMQLFTAINRQGVVFLLPVRLPGEDGKHNEWHRSLLEGTRMAMTRYVRIAANMSLGAYEVFEATGDLPDPVWPDIGFDGLLRVAFRDRFIRDHDHAVIRRLRGEM